jgi:diguanylate cyclase (GGDEF)-like protein/PAS domain S-box-containing protein
VTPLSLVASFGALLFFGTNAMTLVAAAGAVAAAFTNASSANRIRRLLVSVLAASVASQAAGFAHVLLGGTLGTFSWPLQGLPIAGAVVAYCLVFGGLTSVAAPLAARTPIDRSWLKNPLRDCPGAFIAAGIAVGIVEAIGRQAWEILAVASVPLYFVYRAQARQVPPAAIDAQDRVSVEPPDQGVSVVDAQGRVTRWNDALVRMMDCPSERALGGLLVHSVPGLSPTELPRAIGDVIKDRKPRTLARLAVNAGGAVRILRVNIVPDAAGATLFWNDITDQARAEQAVKRGEERFALAAEGANEGLWEWDLRTQEFYASARWKALVGLSAETGIGRPDDWLGRVHADDAASLKRAMDAHLGGETERFQHEHRIRREDGTYRPVLCRGVAARNAGGRPVRIAGSLVEAGDRGAMPAAEARGTGFRDPLTGLCNRADFVAALQNQLDEFKQHPGHSFATLYLDLDRFKVVNDSVGHLVGDELLIGVSRRLEACLRPGDSIARLGGDEFAILLAGLSDQTQANAIAFRLQDALSAPFSVGGKEVFTSASIGIAFSRMEYAGADEMVRDADTAMYHAKARGKARHELFDGDMRARALDRLGLENDLRHAVKNNAFEVYYQPIVSLATRTCTGFESLVRWKRNGEMVSPAKFVPVAEELGLIEALGTWVLQEACRRFADWKRRYPDRGLDCITVNVSTRQLMQQNFLYLVEQTLQEAKMKPSDLRLEITETALMENPTMAAGLLRGLRDYGVKIYLDDFGTGYSSLSHLHKLPVDALKIDRSFVMSLLLDDRPAIVESILALASTLGTSVVAEGVESDLQARELERLGCRQAQGYYFSRPLPADAVEKLLIAHQPLGEPQRAEQAA